MKHSFNVRFPDFGAKIPVTFAFAGNKSCQFAGAVDDVLDKCKPNVSKDDGIVNVDSVHTIVRQCADHGKKECESQIGFDTVFFNHSELGSEESLSILLFGILPHLR